jgi:orotidine-5'-phosphate decarboxylase
MPSVKRQLALRSARSRLIVALDFPSTEGAVRMAETLHGHVGMFKIGSELFGAEGPALVRSLAARGEDVFLDLKFHDIPNTVRGAARAAARLGVKMINVHASGGRKMMEAARDGAREGRTRRKTAPMVLAVTVLTSLAPEDFRDIGIQGSSEEAGVRLARLAQASGLDGVVASAREASAIRRACGAQFLIVTPGIRPAASVADDQQRISTPGQAIRAGADYLVVGRPITASADPNAAAEAILAEMSEALALSSGETTRHA